MTPSLIQIRAVDPSPDTTNSTARNVTTLSLPDLSRNGSRHPATNADDVARARYWTRRGVMFSGAAEHVLASPRVARLRGRIDLIVTSPPFPLNRKKRYGNRQGQDYVQWLASFAPLFRKFLSPDGSIVMEMGNAWEPGHPVMSTLALEALLAFARAGSLNLCQQFICYNPTRLPTPAQWVNVERIRVKDA